MLSQCPSLRCPVPSRRCDAGVQVASNARVQACRNLAPSTSGRRPAEDAHSCSRGTGRRARGAGTLQGEPALPLWACRSVSINPIPEDLRIEVKPEDGSSSGQVEYDEAGKVVRIPLSALGPEGQRRTKLVLFTCNKCGGRTARLVNPVAWEQGVVFGQCGTCEVWHVLSAKNKKIYEEVRYRDHPTAEGEGEGNDAAGAGVAQEPEADLQQQQQQEAERQQHPQEQQQQG